MLYIVVPSPDIEQAAQLARHAAETAGLRVRYHVSHDPDRTGYTAAVNRGLRYVMELGDCEAACVLVDDARPYNRSWLRLLWEALDSDESYGFAGPSGGCRTPPQNGGQRDAPYGVQQVRHVAGFCMLVKAKVMEAGLMDEAFHTYGSEVDWQWRAHLDGWKSVWARHVYVEHEVHAFAKPWGDIDRKVMLQRWGVA